MNNPLVAEMTSVIVKTINPQQIILFGSQATAQAGPNSDYDFLIIEDEDSANNQSRRQKLGQLWRLLARFKVPKDILIFNQDEVEFWRDSTNHIVARAVREGILIYERP